MRLPRLFRARTVPVPTLAGAAVLLLAAASAAGLVALVAGPRLGPFLAVDEPVGRGLLVVEGWMPLEALGQAAETFRRGGYDALVVTGGPVLDPACRGAYATYAEGAGAYVRRLGIDERALVVLPQPDAWDERTYHAAVAVRRWIAEAPRPITAVDVFSYGPHARRSRDVFRLALGLRVAVGSRVAAPVEYDLGAWWRAEAGLRAVVGQGFSWAWMRCCFTPPADSR